MADPKVQVTIAAEDEASEIIRAVQAELKRLDQVAREAAKSGSALADSTSRSAGFFRSMRDGIRDVAKEADVSVKSLGTIEAAASRVGAAPDDVAFGLARFNAQLKNVQTGAPEAVAAFKSIGLSAEDLDKLSLSDAVTRVADQIGRLPTAAEKSSAALALFGREGDHLVPVLRELETGQTGLAESSTHLFDTMRDGIRDVALGADVTVKSLGAIEAAANRIGASPDEVAAGLKSFHAQLEQLSAGAPQAVAAFRAVGLGAEELGKLSLGDAVGRVATQIGRIPTEAGRGAAALQLFGAQGKALVPVLREMEAGQTKVIESSRGFGDMVVQLKQLAIAYGAIKVLDFVRDTIRAADEAGKMAQKLGITTEALSVLRFAVERAGLPVNHIEQAMRSLSNALEDLRSGNSSAVAQFQAIGLSAKDLAGLSLDQAFLKIADAMEKYRDGSGKINVATKIFGRSAIDLLPVLHQLANGGFEEARQKAEELGIVIDDKTAAAAADFNDNVSDLGEAVRGLTIDLTSGLIPALTEMVRVLAQAVPFMKFLAGGIPGLSAIAQASDAGRAGRTPGDQLRALAAQDRAIRNQEAIVSLLPLLDQATNAELNKQASKGKDIVVPDLAALRAALNAKLAADRAGHARELAEFQSFARLAEQLEEQRYARGEKNLKDSYDTRIEIVREQSLAEQKAIQKDIDTLRNTPLPQDAKEADRIAREQQIKDLEEQQNEVMISGQVEVNRLTEEQRLARQALHDQVMGFEAQEQQARGETLKASLGSIELQVRQYELALRQEGALTSDEIQRRTEEFRHSLNNAALANEGIAQVNRVFNDIATQRAEIENGAARGLISQKEAQEEILDLERSRLPELRQMAEGIRAFGEALNNPEIIQSADAILQRLSGMGEAIDEAAVASANFVDSIGGAAKESLIDFLGGGINQADGLRDAFIGLLQQVQQLAARLLVLQAFKGIKGLFGESEQQDGGASKLAAASVALDGSAVALGGSGSVLLGAAAAITAAAAALSAAGAASGAASAASSVAGAVGSFATGGLVSGPGTSTSDSIFARLSRGEFVIRAAAVQQYGADFFAALNGMRQPALRAHTVPRFRDGGLVTADTPAGSEGGADDRLTIGLEDGLVVRQLQSRAGRKIFLQLARENANALKGLLR